MKQVLLVQAATAKLIDVCLRLENLTYNDVEFTKCKLSTGKIVSRK